MSRDYSKEKMNDYLEALGSSSASPGGGSAAAVAACLGTALVGMVVGINNQRELKKNPASKPELDKKQRNIQKLQDLLQACITRDAEVFAKLTACSGNIGESAASQKALKECASVPLEIAERAAEAVDLCLHEKGRTGDWLLSDLHEAAVLLQAAFKSARFNVEINLKSIRDADYVDQTKADLAAMHEEIEDDVQTILLGTHKIS